MRHLVLLGYNVSDVSGNVEEYMTQDNRLQLLAMLPAFLVGATFELFLSHRHDYTGHYAAGYGATLMAGVLCSRRWNDRSRLQRDFRWVVGLVLVCIGCGVISEATIFSFAKFDEIDFCSQSLGAVLAGVVLIAWNNSKMSAEMVSAGLFIGTIFLGLGMYMRSVRAALSVLLVIALLLACENLWSAALRSTIPRALTGAVTNKETRFEKHHGKDDVYLIWLNGQRYQVDKLVYEAVEVGDQVDKQRFGYVLDVEGKSVTLSYSRDAVGLLLAMPVVLLIFGFTGWHASGLTKPADSME